jgi:hypothetical protein
MFCGWLSCQASLALLEGSDAYVELKLPIAACQFIGDVLLPSQPAAIGQGPGQGEMPVSVHYTGWLVDSLLNHRLLQSNLTVVAQPQNAKVP